MSEVADPGAPASVATAAPPVPGLTPPSRRDRHGVFLTDVIVELGFADEQAVDKAVEAARQSARTPERCLLDDGVINEHQLSVARAERNGFDHVDLVQFDVDLEATGLIDRSTAVRCTALPVRFAPDGALIVAFENPTDMLGISDIEVITRTEVRPVIATGTQIRQLIDSLPESAPVSRPAPSEAPPAPGPKFEPDPPTVAIAETPSEPESPPEPESPFEPKLEPESPFELKLEPELEVPEEPKPLPPEPPPEPKPSPPKLRFVPEPPEPTLAPEPESPPGPEPAAELSATLLALQDRTNKAIALAEATERRIDELEDVDARAQNAERELTETREKVASLERRLAEIGAAAEAARTATEELAALSSAADTGRKDE